MHEPRRDPLADAPLDAPTRTRLRAVGLICERCGHEASDERARVEGWHRSAADERVLCGECARLSLELDDAILFWPGCGHVVDNAVLYDQPVCLICEGDDT